MVTLVTATSECFAAIRRSCKVLGALSILLVCGPVFGQNAAIKPLPQAHAHNDYEHARPLFDALSQGFTNIEADVYLVDGQLLVAHDRDQVSSQRTLEGLYLQPLSRIVSANGGKVYPSGEAVTLLIDIKRDGKAAYQALHDLLRKYESIVSVTCDEVFTPKAITVVVSGDRPFASIVESNPRYVGIDGRLSDLESDRTPALMPWISDNWTLHFQYRGIGEMSPKERQKLKEIVTKAHQKKRRVRFWATPELETVWQELTSADVDLIGTDQLAKLGRFLGQQSN
jgi:glycerophosphoryl diester phosphodiesterase